MLPERWRNALPRNVWLGITVVNQEEAERDIPKLLRLPAHVRFLSCEPLLGPVDLDDLVEREDGAAGEHHYSALTCDIHPDDDPWSGACVDWVIAGGESGPNARPMHPAWARSLRDQCAASGTPFFFKQWGEWLPSPLATNGLQVREEPGVLSRDGTWHQPQAVAYPPEHVFMLRVGKKSAGRALDGRTHDEVPA